MSSMARTSSSMAMNSSGEMGGMPNFWREAFLRCSASLSLVENADGLLLFVVKARGGEEYATDESNATDVARMVVLLRRICIVVVIFVTLFRGSYYQVARSKGSRYRNYNTRFGFYFGADFIEGSGIEKS
mmetsp:Transcript_39164/g.94276  ORF Transcript_39164/g.94276 Transcript_39164/m.94276 type:complete len:130 (+) Transcript_39164:288-677(+)